MTAKRECLNFYGTCSTPKVRISRFRDSVVRKRVKKAKIMLKFDQRCVRVNQVINDRYKVIRKIGEGAFGAVYEINEQTESPPHDYAMKIESVDAPPNYQVLKMDINILKRVRSIEARHFCSLIDVGATKTMHYMVLTLVGENLHNLRKRSKGRFTFRTVAHIAINSLEALQDMHRIGYLHRDMKPANLAIGRAPHLRELYLLDFGLCRLYRHEDGRLRRPRQFIGFRGTVRYAPLRMHVRQETCRADDLWSWLYVMVEFATGRLPWDETIKKTNKMAWIEATVLVGVAKANSTNSPTDLMKGCPIEFMIVYDHIRTLKYQSEPDYDLMLNALKQIEDRRREQEKDGESLDWEIGDEKKRKKSR